MDVARPVLAHEFLDGEFVLIPLWFGFLFFHPSFSRIDLAVIVLASLAPRFDEHIEIRWSLIKHQRWRLIEETVSTGRYDNRSTHLVIFLAILFEVIE
jgi:hypothetical protein